MTRTAKKIAMLPGDGIGPEIMLAAERLLTVLSELYGHEFEFCRALVGGAAFEEHGSHFPEETRQICRSSGAILFGAVGGPVSEASLPKWHRCEINSILSLRKEFSFSVNLRPVSLFPELKAVSVLREDIARSSVDLVIVRELVGDVYFGERSTEVRGGKRYARDVAEYSEDQIARAAHYAFRLAQGRRRKVTSVDKANVLDTSKLWRAVVSEVSTEYPDVALEHMLVDNCAMQLVSAPSKFDVIVTSNLFGDILSDEAAALAGSLGLLCSASLNSEGFALYEPPGGSAPDIAGKGLANPVGQILSAAMMLDLSFGLTEEARALERAVRGAIAAGYRTADIAYANELPVSTEQMTKAIESELRRGDR